MSLYAVRNLQYLDFQATEAIQTHLSGKVPGSDFGSLRLKLDSSFVILKQAENRSWNHTAYGEKTRSKASHFLLGREVNCTG